ncbi:ribonuclease H-like domain-containing protein [Rhizophagus clarus]|uniref:Ribonuclease H-like domain-containing protein n=1 Tax=Rhizophagus clarus TaxID=94130 RepID=A0A8H3L0R0_9GLOM|nr:ribonuclease H-like domain-containing protein [Rhizophagus clarus]
MFDNIIPEKLKTGGCPKKPIWRFFEQGDEVDKGHYIAMCLAYHSVREAVKYMVEMREESSNFTSTKRKGSQVEKDQTTLANFYKNSELGNERKGVIDVALIKAFVCCDLPWHLIDHPFFIELLRQLRPNYNLPDRKTLINTLLTEKILRVSVKCYKLLDKEDYLTLVLDDIGAQKFAGIVTDAGSNVHAARNLLSEKFPHILNIRCIAHSLNLITKDLMKHAFAKRIIQWYMVIVTYFKKSHRPKELLDLKIQEKRILGGGLKTYLDTRWTTVHEMLDSISRLEICLKEIVNKNPNVIASEAVKTIINRKRGFFNDVCDLANIMKPIKEAILNLESNKATLADCYFFLAYLGQSINKIPEDDHVAFRQHAIKTFNERFKLYNFDEYLLTYYIHPRYRGTGVKKLKTIYRRIQGAAARIWQQMLKIPDIAAYLKEYKHSKKESAEVLLMQLGEFHLKTIPYNSPYNSNISTSLSNWWKMCIPIPPYLQLLAIKLFSIIPHTANCERIWSICGWMIGKRRTRLSVDNLEAMSKIHSYYITNIKPELPNYGKDQTAEEIRTNLNNTFRNIEDDEIDEYDEEEMAEIVACPFTDNIEQSSSQQLEILNVLDLDLMFRNNPVANKQLDDDELDNFI